MLKKQQDSQRWPHNALILLWFVSLVLSFFTSLFFSFSIALFHRFHPSSFPPVLLFLLCCSFSGPHFRPIPSFSRTSGNISRQTDHLGVRPVNALIVIYSWTEFKKSFSLLTTWSWGPEKKKKVCTISFSLTAYGALKGSVSPRNSYNLRIKHIRSSANEARLNSVDYDPGGQGLWGEQGTLSQEVTEWGRPLTFTVKMILPPHCSISCANVHL